MSIMNVLAGRGSGGGGSPSMPRDPYFNKTIVLIQADDTNAKTNSTFLDNSSAPRAVTAVGNPPQGSFTPYSKIGWSGEFRDPNTIYCTSNDPTTLTLDGNFTIEFWAMRTAYNSYQCVSCFSGGGTVILRINSDNTYGSSLGVSGTNATAFSSLGTWFHCAISKQGTTTYMHINGVQVSVGTDANTWSIGGSGAIIGSYNNIGGQDWYGYISNYRVIKGSTAYALGSTFTPSTSLSVTANTILLLFTSSNVSNAVNNNIVINGTSYMRPISPAVTYAPAYNKIANSGSVRFDGSTQYLTVPANAAFAFGTGDFTVECWVYVITALTGGAFAGSWTGTAATSAWVFTQGNNSTSNLRFGVSNGTTTTFYEGIGGLDYTNSWFHVAAVRSSSRLNLYSNGIIVYSTAETTNISVATQTFQVNGVAGLTFLTTGYISNLRVIKGSAAYALGNTTITVPTSQLDSGPVPTQTQILTCITSGVVDVSAIPKTITNNGGVASVSSLVPFNGTFSYSFNGVTQSLDLVASSTAYTLYGDFTFEVWVYPTALLTTAWGIIDARSSGASSIPWAIALLNTSGSYYTQCYTGTAYNGTIAVSLNTWTHLAWVRNKARLYSYVNGVLDLNNNTFGTGTIDPGTTAPRIGTKDNGIAGYNTQGYMSNLRLINGYAVYTANFTPPTSPVGPVTNTVLLLNGNNAGIVDSTMRSNVGVYGSASISGSIRKGGSGSLNLPSGGYIKTTSWLQSVGFYGPYTVEAWIYWTAVNTGSILGAFATNGWQIYYDGTRICIDQYGIATRVAYTFTPTLSTWYHVAMTRDSANLSTIWINGSNVASGTDTTQYSWVDGWTVGSITASQFVGYIDEVRVTQGVARYTIGFTPTARVSNN